MMIVTNNNDGVYHQLAMTNTIFSSTNVYLISDLKMSMFKQYAEVTFTYLLTYKCRIKCFLDHWKKWLNQKIINCRMTCNSHSVKSVKSNIFSVFTWVTFTFSWLNFYLQRYWFSQIKQTFDFLDKEYWKRASFEFIAFINGRQPRRYMTHLQ